MPSIASINQKIMEELLAGGATPGPTVGAKHEITHRLGGSDAVTLDPAQVTGLPSALVSLNAHAARHAFGGADALTLAQSQITGLPAAITAIQADLAELATTGGSIYNVVTQYGIVGDGVTDRTAALQTIIDNVSAAGGGTIFFPLGVYRMRNLVIKSNITLMGEGYGTSVLKLLDNTPWFSHLLVTGTLFAGAPTNNIKVIGLKLDGNQDQIGLIDGQQHGIAVHGSTNFLEVRDCWFYDFAGDGIWTAIDGGTIPEHINTIGCYFSQMKRQDIAYVHVNKAILVGCRLEGTLDYEPVSAGGVINCTASGNIIKQISCSNAGLDSNITIVGNVITDQVIFFESQSVTFTGNQVQGIARFRDTDKCLVSGNDLKSLQIMSPAGGTATQMIVSGNQIINTTRNGSGPSDASRGLDYQGGESVSPCAVYIYLSENIVIANNLIISEGAFDGIYVDGSCKNIKVSGNQMTGDATVNRKGIRVSASGTEGIEIDGNAISNYDVCVYSAGNNTFVASGSIKNNTFQASSAFQTDLNQWNNLNYFANISIGDKKVSFFSCANLLFKDNVFRTTANLFRTVSISGCLNPTLIGNYFAFDGDTETILLYNVDKALFKKDYGNLNCVNWSGAIVINGSDFYSAALPTFSTWALGQKIGNLSPAAGGTIGWICTTIGRAAPIWTASAARVVGDYRLPTVYNGHVYRCSTAGATGAVQPTWPTGSGATVTDGTVVWTEAGAAAILKTYGSIGA